MHTLAAPLRVASTHPAWQRRPWLRLPWRAVCILQYTRTCPHHPTCTAVVCAGGTRCVLRDGHGRGRRHWRRQAAFSGRSGTVAEQLTIVVPGQGGWVGVPQQVNQRLWCWLQKGGTVQHEPHPRAEPAGLLADARCRNCWQASGGGAGVPPPPCSAYPPPPLPPVQKNRMCAARAPRAASQTALTKSLARARATGQLSWRARVSYQERDGRRGGRLDGMGAASLEGCNKAALRLRKQQAGKARGHGMQVRVLLSASR